jgi:hypothetical protein
MNNNNYLETLNQLFSDSVPSKDKVLGLMDDTMTFFRRIKTKLESNDPAVQKEAFEETMEMKRILETKMRAMAEKTGLDMEQLAALAENTNDMSLEDLNALEAAKAKLRQIQEEDFITKKQ